MSVLSGLMRKRSSGQQDEIKRHEDALNAYSKRRDLGDRLVELRREGGALRNRRLAKQHTAPLDGLEIAKWNEEVDTWEKRVLDAMRGQVSARDYGRFETLDTYMPKVFGWQINSEHGWLLVFQQSPALPGRQPVPEPDPETANALHAADAGGAQEPSVGCRVRHATNGCQAEVDRGVNRI